MRQQLNNSSNEDVGSAFLMKTHYSKNLKWESWTYKSKSKDKFLDHFIETHLMCCICVKSCWIIYYGRQGRRSSWRWCRTLHRCWRPRSRGQRLKHGKDGWWAPDASNSWKEKSELCHFFEKPTRRSVFWATKADPTFRSAATLAKSFGTSSATIATLTPATSFARRKRYDLKMKLTERKRFRSCCFRFLSRFGFQLLTRQICLLRAVALHHQIGRRCCFLVCNSEWKRSSLCLEDEKFPSFLLSKSNDERGREKIIDRQSSTQNTNCSRSWLMLWKFAL